MLGGEVVTHDKNAKNPLDCAARGPLGKIHENPFRGGVCEQASKLRTKWEERKLYPPRGTQVHLLVDFSPCAHDPPKPSGLRALLLWKAHPNTFATL